MFILNGLGYLTLVGVLYLPLHFLHEHRGIVRWVLMAYTAVTVVLWIFIGVRNPLAYFDKLVEIALIILLWVEGQKANGR